jgi:hypothetical protein
MLAGLMNFSLRLTSEEFSLIISNHITKEYDALDIIEFKQLYKHIDPLRFSTFMRRISMCNLSEHNKKKLKKEIIPPTGNYKLYFQEGARQYKNRRNGRTLWQRIRELCPGG